MILMFIITVLLCSLDSFAEPVTLQLMWWSTEGSQEHDLNLEILELFEELNPDVRVEVIFADWNSYADKVWMLMATGEAPESKC
jgi:ABC-type glycerol-3-phosphate transport system substrate-binding protein